MQAVTQGLRGVEFTEGELLVKTLCSDEELKEAYRLRHKVFAERLQWVPPSPERMEVDGYDAWATSVGLFMNSGELVGLFRLLPGDGPIMLETEFKACLSSEYRIHKGADAAEITRLTIDPTLTDKGLSSRLMTVLFKGVYQWSVANDVRYLYMVVEKRFLRVLRLMGFPCEAISRAVALPPAEVLSVAAVLDWDQFRFESARRRPEFLHWIGTPGSAQVVTGERHGGYVEMPAARVA